MPIVHSKVYLTGRNASKYMQSWQLSGCFVVFCVLQPFKQWTGLNAHPVLLNSRFNSLHNDALQYIVCVWGWGWGQSPLPVSILLYMIRESGSVFLWAIRIHPVSFPHTHIQSFGVRVRAPKTACLHRVNSKRGKLRVYTHTHTQAHTYRHTLRPAAAPQLVCDGSGEEGELLA